MAMNRQERSFASIMVVDSNLKAVLGRLLSTPLSSDYSQVGPTMVTAFYMFLRKLFMHSSEMTGDPLLCELLLKLLCELLEG
jgi:hypothetical protein